MSISRRLCVGLASGAGLITGCAPAARAAMAQPVATLSGPAGAVLPAPFYTRVAASPSTVVAEGSETDVWAAAPDGWHSGNPAATLVDAGAPAGVVFSLGVGLSMSQQTVLAGFGTAAVDSVEDVFVAPAGGWSGAVTPVARLAPPAGRPALLNGVIHGRLAIAQTTGPYQPLGPIGVYVEPAGGWSGTVRPRARLIVGGSAVTGFGLAVSAHAIFVSGGSGAWVFVEPRRGWSGTIRPSARLNATGVVSTIGTSVLVGDTLFPRPARGWSGAIRRSGTLAARWAPGATAGSPNTIVTSTMDGIPAGGCGGGCSAHVAAVAKPPQGWTGRLRPVTIVRTSSFTEQLPLATAGADVVFSGGDDVRVYRLGDPVSPAGAGRAPASR